MVFSQVSVLTLLHSCIPHHPPPPHHPHTVVMDRLIDFALCVIFMILVSLENVKKYSHVVARLPQRLKSMLFEIFSTLRVPFGHPPFEKISNNVDFSL